MFGLQATSSAVPSAQLGLYQVKLQQARREAAQAQDNVRALEEQTNEARQQASQAQDRVNSLQNQSPNTTANSGSNKRYITGVVAGAVLDTTA